jgi:hypothetical protein
MFDLLDVGAPAQKIPPRRRRSRPRHDAPRQAPPRVRGPRRGSLPGDAEEYDGRYVAPTFRDVDLLRLERAFAAVMRDPSARAEYALTLLSFQVCQRDMARQAPWFTRFAETVSRHLLAGPFLGESPDVALWVGRFAVDLRDTGVPRLVAEGDRLLALIGPSAR